MDNVTTPFVVRRIAGAIRQIGMQRYATDFRAIVKALKIGRASVYRLLGQASR
jgi:hypothetical protein